MEHVINDKKVILSGLLIGGAFTFFTVKLLLKVYSLGINDQWEETVNFANADSNGIRPVYDEKGNLIIGVVEYDYLSKLIKKE